MNGNKLNQDLPLYLYQVLEEEYESLHGPLPEGMSAYLRNPDDELKPVEVKSKRDWDFREGHIKACAAFAAALLADASDKPPSATGPHDRAKKELIAYLRGKVLDGEREFGEDAAGAQAESKRVKLERDLEKWLNEKVLTDEGLFDDCRFSYRRLGDEARGLLSLRESGMPFDAGNAEHLDRLKHLNRLLLEDAFPKAFHKIANVRLAALNTLIHGKEQSALCLSGGGIRSGTFALGLLQGLARHGLLGQFDYLSTVSGGGYIGSWLTAWIHRHPRGLAGVTRDLAYGQVKKVDPDPEPLQYLRHYSNFITPKVGLLTADTWTFVGIYLRNTFLNSLVFIPLILSVLMIPRLLLALTLMQPELEAGRIEPKPLDVLGLGLIHVPHRYAFLTLGVVFGSWALAYIIFNRPGLRAKLEERRPWFRGKTGQGGFLAMCLLPLLVSAFCLTTYYAWSREVINQGGGKDEAAALWEFLIFGVGFTFIGWLIASVVLKRLNFGRLRETNLLELAGLLAVGLFGGALFYVLAQTNFQSPVIGYDGKFYWLTADWLSWRTEVYVCLAVPLFLLVFLLAVGLFIGFTSNGWFKFIDDEDREWWSRLGAWMLISIIVWTVANVLVIFGPVALLALPSVIAPLGGLSGLAALLFGRSSKTAANESGRQETGKLSGLLGSLLPLLGLFFIAFLIAALSLATTAMFLGLAQLAPWVERKFPWSHFGWWLTNAHDYATYERLVYSGVHADSVRRVAQLVHMNVLHHTWTWAVLAAGLALAGFGVLLARVINLNIFSLHGGYRNRLIRGFLGASRPDNVRKPNPFTGFDPTDDLHMHELRPALIGEDDLLDPGILAARLKDAINHVKERHGGAAKDDAEWGEADEVSLYLVREEEGNERRRARLRNAWAVLQDYAPDAPPSGRLIADLRADLNTLLKVESLYREDFAQPLLSAGRARSLVNAIKRSVGLEESSDIKTVDREKLRSDYHILLNRLVLEAAYPGAFKPPTYPTPPYQLLHVVNTTLNLVGGGNLAWQQRKAEPFSISPLHSGCFRVGYRNSRDYGGRDTNGVSLGTAAAASGAAASSNMGYYTTSPIISLLLTLFNVRLGIWLGNPGPHGQDTYQRNSPRYSFKPIVSEAFGLTDDTNEYVYLTDGGHFENLALYEMVLRRCRFIVVGDGAQDEKYRFGDLGNAVRKIRIDLGVPIEFTDMPIYPEQPPADEGAGTQWALGKIRYSCVDTVWDEQKQKAVPAPDGVLLYVKPAVYGDEPRDVLEYKQSFPAFPHQSTGDQFFDEPQFESYRMLGSHIMDRICGEGHGTLRLRELFGKAYEGLKKAKPETLAQRYRLNAEFIEWTKTALPDEAESGKVTPARVPPGSGGIEPQGWAARLLF